MKSGTANPQLNKAFTRGTSKSTLSIKGGNETSVVLEYCQQEMSGEKAAAG
jgi:muramoyltetrapeptide carboxypeptidase LdcA involved in peptidoglycan recycling